MTDSLVSEFERLEQGVRDRETAAKQAACPHEHVEEFLIFMRPTMKRCRDCGLWLNDA